jgi:hypothetical protein
VEEADGYSSLTFVKPSSLMVVEKNDALLAAAKQFDSKLQALATKVTSTGNSTSQTAPSKARCRVTSRSRRIHPTKSMDDGHS